jgi:uncharacterized C2H2 Zn-finger protein
MHKDIERIKAYYDTRLHRRSIGMAFRCIKCGVIWTRLKDIQEHVKNCNKGESK